MRPRRRPRHSSELNVRAARRLVVAVGRVGLGGAAERVRQARHEAELQGPEHRLGHPDDLLVEGLRKGSSGPRARIPSGRCRLAWPCHSRPETTVEAAAPPVAPPRPSSRRPP